ncbi:hypothetical protein D7I44_08020 [Gryllotalpicola protaetiae]|uniref:YCII-related domain-containing protein n=2 Tax=Gryllotalpicola protaetiae TaxID=2419771 RepID=A0A387BHH3_9MICO|nr:hypothetical protein D7I44_08020 [Gryllotalpicola protaetiae]
MLDNLKLARAYAVVILRKNPESTTTDPRPIVWEHGRRNFDLREQGLLNVVLPVRDDSDLAGIGIFNTTPDEARDIMNEDPGVQAGLFTFEVHEARGFPGDGLKPNSRIGAPPAPPSVP